MKKIIYNLSVIILIVEIVFANALKLEVKATVPSGEVIRNVKDVFGGPTGCMMYLLEDGTLFAGGYVRSIGQLGTPTSAVQLLPATEQVNLSNVFGKVEKVELGNYHSVLLDDRGYVYTTGYNLYGQLGMGNTTALKVFTKVPLPEGVIIKDIAAGTYTSYALATNGDLYGWGRGYYGNLNQGSSLDPIYTPKCIATGIEQFTANKCDGSLLEESLYVVKEDGNLYACGFNGYGQLGTGDLIQLTTLTNIPFFNDKEIKQIQAGTANAFVLLTDGTAYATGYNRWGVLGVNKAKELSVKDWTPVVIPKTYTIEKLFRCSTAQMYQLSDGQVWGSGTNDVGDLGFYSTENYNGTVSYDKQFMTNICTLQQVNPNGDLVQLNPTTYISFEAKNNRTSLDIYKTGTEEDPQYAPIKALSGSWNESFMVDANGYLRVTSAYGDADTSTVPYAQDHNENPSYFQYHRMQTPRRTIKDPEITFNGHKNTITILISGVQEEVAINPTEIIMGPIQSDIVEVYEKYNLYKYNISTGAKEIIDSLTDNSGIVTTDPLSLNIEEKNLQPGDYLIEVYRSATIPTGEAGAGTKLESNHVTKIFSIAENVTLTYNSNTGEDPQTESIEYGKFSNVIISNNTFINEGYLFVNWTTEQDGSGKSYSPSDKLVIEGDTVLYAQWTIGNKIEITGEMLNDDVNVTKISRLNGSFEDITSETSVILKNLDSGKEYIGFLKYGDDDKLIYKNIEYGRYKILCINPSDIECKDTDIPGSEFTFTEQDNNKEITITSNFIKLKGFGNIYENNEM